MIKSMNYQQILDRTLAKVKENQKVPTLFLHCCCAPCSSYVLEYLSQYFRITVFYYNPNISPKEEYEKRVQEIQKFINKVYPNEASLNASLSDAEPVMNAGTECTYYPVTFVEGDYYPEVFYEMAKGMEDLPEKGERCYHCYEMRLREAGRMAKDMGYDYFTTSLSISPYKNAHWLNEIGVRIGEEYGVNYLVSDFKKKNGYKRSIELSNEYGLYRQDYCGCIYSKLERERQKDEESR